MRQLMTDEYKQVIVNILFTIDEICRNYNLTYMLFYGTLLGAVRHKGMIPWDDDIDIVMPRSDYKKLSDIINHGDYQINFIDIDHNSDTIYPWGKVCDKRTIMYEKNFKKVKEYGAFVDVFPLDYAPDDEKLREKERKILRRLVYLNTHATRTGFENSNSLKVNALRLLAFTGSRFVNSQRIIRKINRFVVSRDDHATGYYRVFGGGIFPISWLDRTIEIEFEGKKLLAPHDPDAVLKACFGDYMKLPPEEERINRHTLKCYIND